jgi:hypothetical protein
VVWEGRAGDCSPYPDQGFAPLRAKTRGKYEGAAHLLGCALG